MGQQGLSMGKKATIVVVCVALVAVLVGSFACSRPNGDAGSADQAAMTQTDQPASKAASKHKKAAKKRSARAKAASAANASLPHVAHDGTIRVLCVGNSWTERSIRYLCSIANSAGKKLIIGHAFLRASSLQEQYFGLLGTGKKFTYQDQVRKVRTSYTYRKYVNSDQHSSDYGSTLEHAIQDEPWDYVVLQNRAPESGNYAAWDKRAADNDDALITRNEKGKRRYVHFDVNDFVDLIKSKMAPDVAKHAKFGLSAVWSYAEGQEGGVADSIEEYMWSHGMRYPRDQWDWDTVYERLDRDIQKTMRRVSRHMDGRCSFIVNPGRAFHYARQDEELSEFGYDLHTSDTNAHPADGLPCYLAGLTYAFALLDVDWSDIWFYPDASSKSYWFYDYYDFDTWNKRLTPRLALRAVACAWHAQTGKRINVSEMNAEGTVSDDGSGKQRLESVKLTSPTFGTLERGVDYRLHKKGLTARIQGRGQFTGSVTRAFDQGK